MRVRDSVGTDLDLQLMTPGGEYCIVIATA